MGGGAVRSHAIRGFSGWLGVLLENRISPERRSLLEHDIMIGGAMALGSVIASLAIVFRVARAVREAPQVEPVSSSETAPVLRPVQGW